MAPLDRSPSFVKPTTLQHFTHPIHPLQLLHIPHEFLCNGCSAPGFGTRYHCDTCDFDLHEHCATCPVTTSSPLHPHHPLTLVNQPANHKFCDVCGDLVHGLFYTCRTCEFDVHPLCTQLPLHVQLPLHPHHLLKLQPATAAGCARCFKSCTFWRYKCDTCDVHIHLECALGDIDEQVSQNTPTCQTRSIVPPAQPPPPSPPLPPPFGGFTPGIPVGLGGHGPHGMPPPLPPPFGGFTPGIPVGLGGHGPHGMPGGIMNQPYNSKGHGYGPHVMPGGIMTQPYNSKGNGYGPHGMPGGIMNQPYNSKGNGYGYEPHVMPGIMSQPYSNGHGSGNYGPHGNMPAGIMNEPYNFKGNGYGPHEMNQPNKIQVAGPTSNGRKKRKIYSMVGRLAASAVIFSVTGVPVRF